MKILIISLAGVGDTLMATPLIHELKENFPDSIIDVLVMWNSSGEILKGNPHVNEIIQFNMTKEGFFKTKQFCKELKKRNYDISINTYPQGKIQYRVIAKLIDAKLRLSHRYDNWSFIDNLLVNKTIKQDYGLHCSENNLNLLELLDKKPKLKKHEYELYLSKEDKLNAENYIKKNNLKNKILIGFHMGSGSTKNLALRRWRVENYIELSKKILELDKKIVILLFGKEEEKENKEIANINPERILIVNADSIKKSAAIMGKCKVFLSVDTALMHIASAVGVKYQIAIETPTFNKTVYPYNKDFTLIKNLKLKKDKLEYYRYDGKGIKANEEEIKNIMAGVGVENVFEEIRKVLQ